MLFLQRSCWLVATLGLLMMLAAPSGAQQANSQTQSAQAYERGYEQGSKDQRYNLQPNTMNWSREAQLSAYQSGYRAGYCNNEKVGYYSGTYGYGPPVLRNGYYGYNAPNPYCENNSGNAAFYRGDPKAPQNQVEYGGGG